MDKKADEELNFKKPLSNQNLNQKIASCYYDYIGFIIYTFVVNKLLYIGFKGDGMFMPIDLFLFNIGSLFIKNFREKINVDKLWNLQDAVAGQSHQLEWQSLSDEYMLCYFNINLLR